jgi:AraC-like DNA-binding protein
MGAHELAIVGLAGSGVGTVLGLPMVWPTPRRPLDIRLLGSALLLMSAIAAVVSARLAGLAPASSEVEHAVNLLGLSALPLVVVYTQLATTAGAVPASVRWLWTPAAGYVIFVGARTAAGLESRVAFVWLLPIVLGFTALGAATLWRGRGARRATILPAEWVVAFVVVLNAAQVVRMQFGDVPAVRAVVPLVLSCGFVAIAAFAASKTFADAEPGDVPAMAGPELAAGVGRYERSGLEQSAAPDLLARIDRALTHERLFARADLTLAHLAAAVGATAHQVSEALNRYGGVSFHDLVNRHRVDDVKAQLIDPASERFTIEGIGASAGFGSRSALYAAFRRFEGITPAAFRAAQRAQPSSDADLTRSREA